MPVRCVDLVLATLEPVGCGRQWAHRHAELIALSDSLRPYTSSAAPRRPGRMRELCRKGGESSPFAVLSLGSSWKEGRAPCAGGGERRELVAGEAMVDGGSESRELSYETRALLSLGLARLVRPLSRRGV